ncbi:hypothetical protein A1F96_10760, partial [Pyrenophora tritici-repentis]
HPPTIRLTPTPSLTSAQTSLTHQLYMLDFRGHDARDMQRTLNYINAELRMRQVEGIAVGTDGQAEVGQIKKKNTGARVEEMQDEDKRWEKESGGNPRWGEGRTAGLYGK